MHSRALSGTLGTGAYFSVCMFLEAGSGCSRALREASSFVNGLGSAASRERPDICRDEASAKKRRRRTLLEILARGNWQLA